MILNSHTDVWDVSGEQPFWLNVGVRQLRWRTVDKAVLTLYAELSRPPGQWLCALEEAPAVLEIVHKGCGSRDEYVSEEVFIRLSRCRLGHKWMENLVVESLSDQGVVQIFVNVVGCLEVLL